MNKFVNEYQCSGCINGDGNCYRKEDDGIGCAAHKAGTAAHKAGTMILGIGKIFLGMPKGFDRLGDNENLRPRIFEKYSDCDWFEGVYGTYTIPTWKYLTKEGHTLVRGMTPRINSTFLLVFLEDCISDIDCLEITQKELDFME